MKKINAFSLIGLVFFNLTGTLALSITAYALVAAAWISAISFILSPFLVVLVAVFQLQTFSIFSFISGLVLCTVSIIMFPLLKRLTADLLSLSKKYRRLNKAALSR